MRKYLRQIAKARMTIMGIGNVNKKLHLKNHEGIPNWKVALYGKTGQEAEQAQWKDGQRIKQAKEAKKSIMKLRVKKVAVS